MHVDPALPGAERPINTPPESRLAAWRDHLSRAVAGAGPQAPLIALAGVGLLICSLANALSRAALAPSPLLLWAGILLIALPIFYRLTSREASARERLLLVCILGLSLYAVKVMRDSPLFTFSDELVHAFNADRIVDSNELFRANPILEVTPYYPGLEGATSALMKLTGLSSYTAGVIIVGAARLVLIASLFLLFLRVGGSARAAGLGAALYAGNFNFLYWGAEYSYESLALPLLLMAMMGLAVREAAPRDALRAWAVPVALAMAAIIVTHHLTSYALAILLSALTLSYWYVHRSWRPPNPWPFAAFGLVLALAWLVVVASTTVGYLTPVLSNAVEAIGNTISGEDPPRGLFEGESAVVPATPLLARAVGVLAVLLLAAALPFGLKQLWRRYRAQPFALLFGLAAIAFFGTLALRLAPPAWETGNRASEFLFVGLAFVVALACLEALRRWPRKRTRALLAAGVSVVLVGGAIAGWPWDSMLAQPLRISAGGRTISSPPLGMAEWAAERTPKKGRFAASVADAGLLLSPGKRTALAGTSPDIEDIIDAEGFSGWELPLLRRRNLRYVVADRREVNADTLRGYYFARPGTYAAELMPRSVVSKFNRIPGAARVYTNGTITVFDLRGRP
jgi:hypothetical protein